MEDLGPINETVEFGKQIDEIPDFAIVGVKDVWTINVLVAASASDPFGMGMASHVILLFYDYNVMPLICQHARTSRAVETGADD